MEEGRVPGQGLRCNVGIELLEAVGQFCQGKLPLLPASPTAAHVVDVVWGRGYTTGITGTTWVHMRTFRKEMSN